MPHVACHAITSHAVRDMSERAPKPALPACELIVGMISATGFGVASSCARSSAFSRKSLSARRFDARNLRAAARARVTARVSLAATESAQRESDRRKMALSRSTAAHRLLHAESTNVGPLALSTSCGCRRTGAASAHARTTARLASLSPTGAQTRIAGALDACDAGIGCWSCRPGVSRFSNVSLCSSRRAEKRSFAHIDDVLDLKPKSSERGSDEL